jgi:hypothetical protein
VLLVSGPRVGGRPDARERGSLEFRVYGRNRQGLPSCRRSAPRELRRRPPPSRHRAFGGTPGRRVGPGTVRTKVGGGLPTMVGVAPFLPPTGPGSRMERRGDGSSSGVTDAWPAARIRVLIRGRASPSSVLPARARGRGLPRGGAEDAARGQGTPSRSGRPSTLTLPGSAGHARHEIPREDVVNEQTPRACAGPSTTVWSRDSGGRSCWRDRTCTPNPPPRRTAGGVRSPSDEPRPADVLGVGAGPTGLAPALQAHDHGVRVRPGRLPRCDGRAVRSVTTGSAGAPRRSRVFRRRVISRAADLCSESAGLAPDSARRRREFRAGVGEVVDGMSV